MKYLILILILSTSVTFAKKPVEQKRAIAKSPQFDPKLAADQLDNFSEIEKLNDPEKVFWALKTIVILDSIDPSGVFSDTLAVSYNQNKRIYDQAFDRLTKEEKKIVQKHFNKFKNSKNGQG